MQCHPRQQCCCELDYKLGCRIHLARCVPGQRSWKLGITTATWYVHSVSGELATALLIQIDNVVDPGSYVWLAEPLQTLPITDGFHFCIWAGGASASADLTPDNSFNSGALFVLGRSASQTIKSSSLTSKTTATSVCLTLFMLTRQ